MLGLFVKRLITDDKYSSRDIENFEQQFQTPLSQKVKTFSGFCFVYVESP